MERRDSLKRLRDVAGDATKDDTSGIEWAQEYGRRPSGPSTVAGDPLGPRRITPSERPDPPDEPFDPTPNR